MQTNSFVRILMRWDVLVALAILVATGIVKWNAQQVPPPIVLPKQTLPSPNAYDYYVQAEKVKINNTGLYKPTATIAEKKATLESMMPAKRLIETGMKYPHAYPVDQSDNIINYYGSAVNYADAFDLQSDVDAAAGKYDDALNEDLKCFRFAISYQQGSGWDGVGIGQFNQNDPRKQAAALINHISLPESIKGAYELTNLNGQNITPVIRLARTKSDAESLFLRQFKNRYQLLDSFNVYLLQPNVTPRRMFAMVSGKLKFAMESPKRETEVYLRYVGAIAAYNKLPWSEQIKTTPPPTPFDFYFNNVSFIDEIGPGPCECMDYFYTLTANNLLATQLALHAYKLEHGKYPDQLSQLVPKYLPMLPTDFFAEGAPLKYARNGFHYTLYSVGFDAIDNGGKPIAGNPYSLWELLPGHYNTECEIANKIQGDLVVKS